MKIDYISNSRPKRQTLTAIYWKNSRTQWENNIIDISKTPRHKTNKPSIYNSLAADTKASTKHTKITSFLTETPSVWKIWIPHQVWKYQFYIILHTQNLLFYPKLEQTLLKVFKSCNTNMSIASSSIKLCTEFVHLKELLGKISSFEDRN